MSTTAPTIEDLRPVDLFDDLSDEELEPWAAVAVPRFVPRGELLVEQGEEAEGLLLILEGTASVALRHGAAWDPLGHQHGPTWSMAIPVMMGIDATVRMQAETDVRMLVIPAEDFRRLARATQSVHQRVMQVFGPVTARLNAVEQNREHLASLGTMAAGLAHELNNPAAAAQRSAQQLAEALETISSAMSGFVEAGIERDAAEGLVALQREATERAAAADAEADDDELAIADAEDEISDRLTDLGVEEPWTLAEPLAAAGLDADWLGRVEALAGGATGVAVGWVAATLTARGLASELRDSTERMSDLVRAVKTYAYMDRGELVEVDIHEGIKTTLKVLAHKWKHREIELDKDLDLTIPKLTVHGSELNQVWTNLIDNALDAMGDSGTLGIRTRLDGECVLVEITDDGPGIPEEAQSHVFDSFFTTKDVGSGTGLGLATARRIVVDRHSGSLWFESEPGRTSFFVRLPLAQNGGAEPD
ncbi:cyclic nucleotide-binding domain-containing protein [Thermoleophilia bacterium SCSIO 60948]|nr:cyclic nucleotide-binding domain-containing protein [Thermoleophilia bacterium SCSIO 60948]